MLTSSIWIITWFLKVFLVEGNLSINRYSQATDNKGLPLCSVNDPSATIYDVRRRLSCLLEHCVPTESCLSASYYADTGKCELFHYPPIDFFKVAQGCTSYKVRDINKS